MPDLSEERLIEKLRAIEALHARPGSEGEKVAAANARERILERLREVSAADAPKEFRFSMPDIWAQRVFLALLRRYEIEPYRYAGQRRTTVMAEVPKRFLDETLMPEFRELHQELQAYLAEMTERVISQVLHADVADPTEIAEPPQLPPGED